MRGNEIGKCDFESSRGGAMLVIKGRASKLAGFVGGHTQDQPEG